MPRKARAKQPEPPKSTLPPELAFRAAQWFIIDNLAWLRYIGCTPSIESIKAHNRVAGEYGLAKIDPMALKYVDKADERWLSL